MTQEIWKPVYLYEGYYEVSNIGRVRSVRRNLILKQFDLKVRMAVGLNVNGVKKLFYVHRLVLEAFVCPRPQGMCCCHGDGDYKNNNVENLRWGTYSDNMQDAIMHGTRFFNRGESHAKTHLSNNDVREIRKLLSSGVKQSEIAKRYGVVRTAITNIKTGATWSNIK